MKEEESNFRTEMLHSHISDDSFTDVTESVRETLELCTNPECQHYIQYEQLKARYNHLKDKYKKTRLVLKQCQRLYEQVEREKCEEIEKSNSDAVKACNIL
ncbi:hypothetical protein RF11_03317 [Thelohanellus kitauei]|uniref:Uncharacterized protein n=1 Tax=Thelohanellus kitauei TaxID=669202 RepID=A0A0C2NEI9_THEKT|nr:hypothetical protein RF11_03317 [Thelohanellus kitauei]